MRAYNVSNALDLGHPFPKKVDHIKLSAGVAKSYTIPAGYNTMLINSTATFYMAGEDNIATIPSGDITNGTGVVPSTGGFFQVKRMSGKTISFISSSDCNIGIILYT